MSHVFAEEQIGETQHHKIFAKKKKNNRTNFIAKHKTLPTLALTKYGIKSDRSAEENIVSKLTVNVCFNFANGI